MSYRTTNQAATQIAAARSARRAVGNPHAAHNRTVRAVAIIAHGVECRAISEARAKELIEALLKAQEGMRNERTT